MTQISFLSKLRGLSLAFALMASGAALDTVAAPAAVGSQAAGAVAVDGAQQSASAHAAIDTAAFNAEGGADASSIVAAVSVAPVDTLAAKAQVAIAGGAAGWEPANREEAPASATANAAGPGAWGWQISASIEA